jgi:hypothetical protein
MTQKDKDLLLKDLCARLPYGVKADLKQTNCHDSINKVSEKDVYSFRTNKPLEEYHGQHDYYKVIVTDIKSYLFPLSSMTEEQTEELLKLINTGQNDNNEFMRSLCRIEFYHKNHFDYRGLIPKGLANDATSLNIY